jgi:hypothetical protein
MVVKVELVVRSLPELTLAFMLILVIDLKGALMFKN